MKRKKKVKGGPLGILDNMGTRGSFWTLQGNPPENWMAHHPSTFPESRLSPFPEP